MRRLILSSVVVVLLAPTVASAQDRDRSKEQVEFGIKVAQSNLWNEALYRWQKAVELDPESFPAHHATIFVRHPTSTGPVTAATSKNLAIVSAATSAVSGNQRVLLTAPGGGSGVCPGSPVGAVGELALRP